jgi:UDP-N-acetylglucosamine--N-acetylmuramyl-(pentapeptide) pyrophosphoryl-undecaprenol N-acetylglucosamine transferase
MAHLVIAAGGTGGHIFPALAVADALRASGDTVSWLGTAEGLEARVVPEAGYDLDTLSVAGLRGNGAGRWLAAPWRLSRAVFGARRVLAQRGADAVLGMGGFAAGPGGVAARLTGRPLVIHEQNASAGLTNRALARMRPARVLAAFPGAFPERVGATVTGNPVRADIAALPEPAARFQGREGPLRILVLGGSQGALALNRTVPAAVAAMERSGEVEVHHQAGQREQEEARATYAEAGVTAEVVPFIEDMAAAYGWADLVIARSGALTVAELAAAGVGSLLVPFPHAVDDHQTRNAAYLADVGAAQLWPQDQLEVANLARALDEVAADAARGRGGLRAMATAARKRARPEAAETVAAICREVSHG